MRINRITLNNFRIYKGENNLVLKPCDASKNITIIAGQNGFGKTTFLTALVWGFYGKLIGEVDEKYKKDIYEAGGYKKYAKSVLNREIRADETAYKKYNVEIEISDIYIPSVPCRKIIIHREYDTLKETETCRVLIDGFENELTKEVGSDIFINDFILPREIAKFFFFDAEKIVSLAEIKTTL
jgi:DNA sulfur modification protein DndD